MNVRTASVSDGRAARRAQDNIPPTKVERDRLLRLVADYVAVRKPTPPLSSNELTLHADSIIRGAGSGPGGGLRPGQAGADAKYRKFISVLVNNEVWRDTLAGIPFARRLLLLPKCLRREGQCPATFDELGLHCRRCGRCAIADLSEQAERLGYAVLVAEGSAAVTAMIEARKLQAIVGVSCMTVLERVFPHMESAAIPGLAIPLLYDGCRQTAADMDWVWDAIGLTREDKTWRLDLDGLRGQLDRLFQLESLNGLLGPADTETERLGRQWLARSGKRWRPFLAVCAYQAFQEQPEAAIPGPLAKLAVAVECFHKASLIHDDIEDNDATRYGEQTLHAEHGVPIALNVGDFLIGEGYRLIAEAGGAPGGGQVAAAVRAAMLEAAIEGHRSLCIGQGEELSWVRRPRPMSPAEVLAVFRRKTAPAFEVALRLGALFAGAGDPVRQVIRQYSESLGIAYQIRDDLEDFDPANRNGDANGRGSPIPKNGDWGPLKPSLLLSIAHELAGGQARELLEQLWRNPTRAAEHAEQVSRLFDRLDVRQTARELLESFKAEAIRSLASLANANLKGLLRRVLGRIFDGSANELKGWCGEFDGAGTDAPSGRGGAGSAA